MEPTNSQPMQTSNPVPNAAGGLPPNEPVLMTNPAAAAAPNVPSAVDASDVATMQSATPGASAPVTSGVPGMQATQTATPTQTNMPQGIPAVPAMAAGAMPMQPPINPVIRPTGMKVTEPILEPEQPPAPDPVEEELKAPMKAAEPVPGSIGSAVSGPAGAPAEGQFMNNNMNATPSVSFNDPAMQQGNGLNMAQNAAPKAKTIKIGGKDVNKNTLIALIGVATVIVIVLVIILVMQLNGAM